MTEGLPLVKQLRLWHLPTGDNMVDVTEGLTHWSISQVFPDPAGMLLERRNTPFLSDFLYSILYPRGVFSIGFICISRRQVTLELCSGNHTSVFTLVSTNASHHMSGKKIIYIVSFMDKLDFFSFHFFFFFFVRQERVVTVPLVRTVATSARKWQKIGSFVVQATTHRWRFLIFCCC